MLRAPDIPATPHFFMKPCPGAPRAEGLRHYVAMIGRKMQNPGHSETTVARAREGREADGSQSTCGSQPRRTWLPRMMKNRSGLNVAKSGWVST